MNSEDKDLDFEVLQGTGTIDNYSYSPPTRFIRICVNRDNEYGLLDAYCKEGGDGYHWTILEKTHPVTKDNETQKTVFVLRGKKVYEPQDYIDFYHALNRN